MKAKNVIRAVKSYCEAYDRYHTLYATFRLQGWDGSSRTCPAILIGAQGKLENSLEVLRASIGLGPRPNYTEEAKKRTQG